MDVGTLNAAVTPQPLLALAAALARIGLGVVLLNLAIDAALLAAHKMTIP